MYIYLLLRRNVYIFFHRWHHPWLLGNAGHSWICSSKRFTESLRWQTKGTAIFPNRIFENSMKLKVKFEIGRIEPYGPWVFPKNSPVSPLITDIDTTSITVQRGEWQQSRLNPGSSKGCQHVCQKKTGSTQSPTVIPRSDIFETGFPAPALAFAHPRQAPTETRFRRFIVPVKEVATWWILPFF